MAEPALSLWTLLALAVAATFVWRLAGVFVAGRLREDGPLFAWVAAVAYAMVAGLMARILIMPRGDITLEGMGPRLAALAVAFAVWYLRGRSLTWGLAAGVGCYAALMALGF